MLMWFWAVWEYRASEAEEAELYCAYEASRDEPEVDSGAVAGSDDGVDGCD